MGGIEGGSTVSACTQGPVGPDFRELAEARLNPYILHDDAGESNIPIPSSGVQAPGQGTQPAPVDPQVGGEPIGGIDGMPGGSGNPDRP